MVWESDLRVVLGTSIWVEARGRPKTWWRDYISHLAWKCLGVTQKELESIAGEKEAWDTLLWLDNKDRNIR